VLGPRFGTRRRLGTWHRGGPLPRCHLARTAAASLGGSMVTTVAGSPEAVDLDRRRHHLGAARDLWPTFLVLAIPAGFVMVAAWSRRWTSDDGFIDVHIVQQIFAGHGPVFNAGERVEAGTSPAWTGLLVLGRIVFFGLATEWVAVIFGIAATTGAIVLAEVAGLRLYRTTQVLPFGLVAFVVLPPVWDFATAGLETGLCFLWIAPLS
jgi:arabinofuranosyltransferase